MPELRVLKQTKSQRLCGAGGVRHVVTVEYLDRQGKKRAATKDEFADLLGRGNSASYANSGDSFRVLSGECPTCSTRQLRMQDTKS